MKNITLLVAFVMLLTATSIAQTYTVQDSGSVNFDAFVQTTFANVNTAGVTTGKLMNRAPDFINIGVYDGSFIADSLAMTMDSFLHCMLWHIVLPCLQHINCKTLYEFDLFE